MKTLLTIVFFYLSNLAFSQILSPQELIDSGIVMNDKEKYDEAIKLYSQINENDKKYPTALYEIALSYLKKKDYKSALKYIDLYEKNQYINDLEGITILKGACYDEQKQYQKAIDGYNEVLKKFPNSARILHHMGISYYFKEEKQKAIDYFEKAYYVKSNYTKNLNAMTQLASDGGLLVEALLAGLHSALYSVGNENNQNILASIEQIVTQKPSQITKEYSFSKEGDDFSSMNEMLRSQVALQSKYKIDCDFDYPFVKQSHLLLSLLQDYEPKNGYFDIYFVPFYKKIMKEGKFDAFIYTLLADNNSDKVQSIVKKHKDEIKDFIKWSREALKTINVREFEVEGKKVKLPCYYESSDKLCGELKDNKQDGVWYTFYSNGNLKNVGNSKEGNAEGVWNYYDENNMKVSSVNFSNNNKNGPYTTYFAENQIIKEKGNFDNDSLSGMVYVYYPNGVMKLKVNYVDNKEEGVRTNYISNGKKQSESTFSKGNLNGEEKEYYLDGVTIEKQGNNLNGYLDGEYKEYYSNSKIYKEIGYKKGEMSGKFKEYYSNGKLAKEVVYDNNKPTDVISYFVNGKVESSSSVSKDEIKVRKENDFDGDLYANYYVKNDEIEKIEFIDKAGKIIETKKIGKNDMYEDKWYYTNKIATKGRYKNYKKDGVWSYYNIEGILKKEYTFKEGVQDGLQKEYSESGNLNYEYWVQNDEQHGEFKSYFQNGNLKSKGIYRNGSKNGLWIDYFANGTISEETYYFNDKIQGKSNSYDAKGKLYKTYIFDNDFLKEIISYNLEGGIESRYDLLTDKFNELPNSKMKYHQVINERVFGKYEGPYLYMVEPDLCFGSGNYKSNIKVGRFNTFYENGSIYQSTNYVLGDEDGADTVFYLSQKPYIISNYSLGKEDGLTTKYYYNGNKMYEKNYVMDKLDGISTYYSLNGDEILKKHYKLGYMDYYIQNNSEGILKDTIYSKSDLIEIKANHKNGKQAIYETINKGDFVKYQLFSDKGQVLYEYDSDKKGNLIYRKIYYANGNLLSDEKYEGGIKQGETSYYNEDGTLALVLPHVNNQVEGVVKIYKNNQIAKQYLYRLNLPYDEVK